MTPGRASRPAIILGGNENALSVARNLSCAGIPVYFLNRPSVPARYSRHGRWLALDGGSNAPQDWKRFLLGAQSDRLAGAVLLACSDDAIELIGDNYAALAEKFLLEECPTAVRRGLLDKLSTYEIARAAGIPVPGFWFAASAAEKLRVAEECRFPVVLKPRLSHHSARIGRKHIRADTKADLEAAFRRLEELGIPAVVMEFIPGGDDKLCSYYSYFDESGAPLVHFTKRHPRRYPANLGGATYHETTWDAEAAALGERFFRHAGLRGLGNIEFKRDDRDGKLKIIESNARFTASDALISRCGVDFAKLTYDRLTGRPPAPFSGYRSGMVLWFPIEDFLAFRELRRRGEITWGAWLRSVRRTEILPYFRWDDPLPSLMNLLLRTRSLARGAARRLSGISTEGSGGAHDADRRALSRSGRTGAR
jgi:predicted ATP-grasp superfamily ATP-dependent carboligase